MAVASRWIVERLDVVSDVSDREFPVLVDSFLDALFLQTAEEGLGHRIVIAVPAPAHARFKAVRFAETSPIITSILRPLVRVNECLPGTTAADGHHDRVEGELSGDCRSGCPPDYLS